MGGAAPPRRQAPLQGAGVHTLQDLSALSIRLAAFTLESHTSAHHDTQDRAHLHALSTLPVFVGLRSKEDEEGAGQRPLTPESAASDIRVFPEPVPSQQQDEASGPVKDTSISDTRKHAGGRSLEEAPRNAIPFRVSRKTIVAGLACALLIGLASSIPLTGAEVTARVPTNTNHHLLLPLSPLFG